MPEILKLHDTNFEIVCFCGLELLLKTTALNARNCHSVTKISLAFYLQRENTVK